MTSETVTRDPVVTALGRTAITAAEAIDKGAEGQVKAILEEIVLFATRKRSCLAKAMLGHLDMRPGANSPSSEGRRQS